MLYVTELEQNNYFADIDWSSANLETVLAKVKVPATGVKCLFKLSDLPSNRLKNILVWKSGANDSSKKSNGSGKNQSNKVHVDDKLRSTWKSIQRGSAEGQDCAICESNGKPHEKHATHEHFLHREWDNPLNRVKIYEALSRHKKQQGDYSKLPKAAIEDLRRCNDHLRKTKNQRSSNQNSNTKRKGNTRSSLEKEMVHWTEQQRQWFVKRLCTKCGGKHRSKDCKKKYTVFTVEQVQQLLGDEENRLALCQTMLSGLSADDKSKLKELFVANVSRVAMTPDLLTSSEVKGSEVRVEDVTSTNSATTSAGSPRGNPL